MPSLTQIPEESTLDDDDDIDDITPSKPVPSSAAPSSSPSGVSSAGGDRPQQTSAAARLLTHLEEDRRLRALKKQKKLDKKKKIEEKKTQFKEHIKLLAEAQKKKLETGTSSDNNGAGASTASSALLQPSYAASLLSLLVVVLWTVVLITSTHLMAKLNAAPGNAPGTPPASCAADGDLGLLATSLTRTLAVSDEAGTLSAPGLRRRHAALRAELERVRADTKDSARVEIAEETDASGSFAIPFLNRRMALSYDGVPYLLMRVTTTAAGGVANNGSTPSVMLAAHYDATVGTPGAADCAGCVGAAVEAAMRVAFSQNASSSTTLVALNGAEEVFMAGAHAVTSHPWYDDVRAFINLEATGTDGPDMIFQSNAAWALDASLHARSHKHASSIAHDFFRAGLVPGDTDYKVYGQPRRDAACAHAREEAAMQPDSATAKHAVVHCAGIAGIDMALIGSGERYHTIADSVEATDRRVLARRVDDAVKMANALHAAIREGKHESAEPASAPSAVQQERIQEMDPGVEDATPIAPQAREDAKKRFGSMANLPESTSVTATSPEAETMRFFAVRGGMVSDIEKRLIERFTPPRLSRRRRRRWAAEKTATPAFLTAFGKYALSYSADTARLAHTTPFLLLNAALLYRWTRVHVAAAAPASGIAAVWMLWRSVLGGAAGLASTLLFEGMLTAVSGVVSAAGTAALWSVLVSLLVHDAAMPWYGRWPMALLVSVPLGMSALAGALAKWVRRRVHDADMSLRPVPRRARGRLHKRPLVPQPTYAELDRRASLAVVALGWLHGFEAYAITNMQDARRGLIGASWCTVVTLWLLLCTPDDSAELTKLRQLRRLQGGSRRLRKLGGGGGAQHLTVAFPSLLTSPSSVIALVVLGTVPLMFATDVSTMLHKFIAEKLGMAGAPPRLYEDIVGPILQRYGVGAPSLLSHGRFFYQSNSAGGLFFDPSFWQVMILQMTPHFVRRNFLRLPSMYADAANGVIGGFFSWWSTGPLWVALSAHIAATYIPRVGADGKSRRRRLTFATKLFRLIVPMLISVTVVAHIRLLSESLAEPATGMAGAGGFPYAPSAPRRIVVFHKADVFAPSSGIDATVENTRFIVAGLDANAGADQLKEMIDGSRLHDAPAETPGARLVRGVGRLARTVSRRLLQSVDRNVRAMVATSGVLPDEWASAILASAVNAGSIFDADGFAQSGTADGWPAPRRNMDGGGYARYRVEATAASEAAAWYPVTDMIGTPLRVIPAPPLYPPKGGSLPDSWRDLLADTETRPDEFPSRGLPYLVLEDVPSMLTVTPCPGTETGAIDSGHARVILRYNVTSSVRNVLPGGFLAVFAQPAPLPSNGKISRHGTARIVSWSLADGVPRAERGGGPQSFDEDAEYYVFRHARGDGVSATPTNSVPPPVQFWMVVETNNCTESTLAWRTRPRSRKRRHLKSTTMASRFVARVFGLGGERNSGDGGRSGSGGEASSSSPGGWRGARSQAERDTEFELNTLVRMQLSASYTFPTEGISKFVERVLWPVKPSDVDSSPNAAARWMRMRDSVTVLHATVTDHIATVQRP